jgi:glycosyltransferase involved in cell wall biosynthesis
VSEDQSSQLRVLHLVSARAVTGDLQQSLFMPLLTRMPKQRVTTQIAQLAPEAIPAALFRQQGVPVHDVPLSRKRFAAAAFRELLDVARTFRPDIVQAWGHTAQLVALALRSRCDWQPKVVWSIAGTAPLGRDAGLIDRLKLKWMAKVADRPDRIVYTAEASALAHRRVGYPGEGYGVIAPGVDGTRFKPDGTARNKMREQLQVPPQSFLIGMVAPFQPEYDHATFLKAIGELIKTNPNLCVALAGHGIQRGNAPLMALIGGGTLAMRTQLLGELSDVAPLFNACDLVCSSAVTDSARMTLVTAMLCGVPVVATGMGSQGEVVGKFGVAVEPGSSAAFVRGITRIMQMPPDKRAFMAQGARKHALEKFMSVRTLQKYLQLYCDLAGRAAVATQEVPAPEIDASVSVPTTTAAPAAPVAVAEIVDPDSLETRAASKPEAPKLVQDDADVFKSFEAAVTKPAAADSTQSERARGVAEDIEDLLAPEALAATAPLERRKA